MWYYSDSQYSSNLLSFNIVQSVTSRTIILFSFCSCGNVKRSNPSLRFFFLSQLSSWKLNSSLLDLYFVMAVYDFWDSFLIFTPGQASMLLSQLWLMKALLKSDMTHWRKWQLPAEPVSDSDNPYFTWTQRSEKNTLCTKAAAECSNLEAQPSRVDYTEGGVGVKN